MINIIVELTPEDTSKHEILNQEYSALEEKVKDYVSKEIVEHKSNYEAFIDASEKLTDKDRRNYIEARQSKLESNVDKLNEFNTFAHDLLEQRAAVVANPRLAVPDLLGARPAFSRQHGDEPALHPLDRQLGPGRSTSDPQSERTHHRPRRRRPSPLPAHAVRGAG